MSVAVKYNSRQVERTDSGIVTTLAWIGPRSEIETFGASERPGAAGNDGVLESVRIYQDSGHLWVCERRYRTDQNGEMHNKPNVNFGQKSASLHGSMLSMPLETNPEYRTCWNYFLAAAPGITAVPEWWETAKDTIIIDGRGKYAWIKSPGEVPISNNVRWEVLREPKKPGRNSYDLATYSVTETAKFTSPEAAGRMVANKLNRIGKPDEDFGITGGDWKCDDATVSYHDRAWFATLTWTRSGDANGWDKEIYKQI